MYAEIKSNNEILVNRLDDSERILLKNIVEASKEDNKVVKLEGIYDDNGDFGGTFIRVESKTEE